MKHTTPELETLSRRARRRGPCARLLVLVALSAGAAAGCRGTAPAGPVDRSAGPPLLAVISFDGFRWDYADFGVSPNLQSLIARGVRADGLIPSFPTKTFPNHYTLVTGLVPDHHGIVANTMWDPSFESTFSMSDRVEVRDERWWEGEPVWITAERHGIPTAPLFWAGSEASYDGRTASHWLPFDVSMPNADRVDWVLARLDLPENERPRFVTLYFEETDIAGHNHGPRSEEVRAAVRSVDAALGRFLAGLAERNLLDRTNVIVLSDHGMSPTSPDRVIFVDDYVDIDAARPVDWNPVLALWPDERDAGRVYRSLRGAHPRLAVYWKDSIPARFEYGTHPRVAPIVALADDGWSIATHAYFEEGPWRLDGGNHGFDHEARDMMGIFIAAGPDFRTGARVPAFRNVHVYPLLMHLLDLPAASSDGDLSGVDTVLAR